MAWQAVLSRAPGAGVPLIVAAAPELEPPPTEGRPILVIRPDSATAGGDDARRWLDLLACGFLPELWHDAAVQHAQFLPLCADTAASFLRASWTWICLRAGIPAEHEDPMPPALLELLEQATRGATHIPADRVLRALQIGLDAVRSPAAAAFSAAWRALGLVSPMLDRARDQFAAGDMETTVATLTAALQACQRASMAPPAKLLCNRAAALLQLRLGAEAARDCDSALLQLDQLLAWVGTVELARASGSLPGAGLGAAERVAEMARASLMAIHAAPGASGTVGTAGAKSTAGAMAALCLTPRLRDERWSPGQLGAQLCVVLNTDALALLRSLQHKALVRLALAYEQSGEPARAAVAAQAALERALPPALGAVAADVRRRAAGILARAGERAPALSGTLFQNGAGDAGDVAPPAPQTLVLASQPLRLYLRARPPTEVHSGQRFRVSLYAVNEFGLLPRSWLRDAGAVPLSLQLLPLRHLCSPPDQSLADGSAACQLRVHGPAQLSEAGKAELVLEVCSDGDKMAGREVHFVIQFSAMLGACSHDIVSVCTPPATLLPLAAKDAAGAAAAPASADAAPDRGRDADIAALLALTSDPVAAAGVSSLRRVPAGAAIIVLAEAEGLHSIAGRVWDGALLLTRFLERNAHLVRGRRCVELGCGTGLAGMACAALGAASVAVTDLPAVVPIVQRAMDVNRHLHALWQQSVRERGGAALPWPLAAARALPYSWGEDASALGAPLDTVVMCDVVYDPEGYLPLLRALLQLCDERTEVVMCHRHRNPRDGEFFEAFSREFDVQDEDRSTVAGVAGFCDDMRLIRARRRAGHA